MNKQILYIIKDEEVIITGTCNNNDDLWYIPIHNPDLLKYNPINPSGHTSIYITHHHKNNPIPRTYCCPNTHPTTYHNDFNDLEDLIALSKCNYEVNNQLKADQLHDIPKLNIIIYKDKTKTDLTDYFYAALLSLVKSTILEAINNNHFTTWSGMDIKFYAHIFN